MIIVEQLKGRHRASFLSLVINTSSIGRITDGHVQNVRLPARIGDMEVRPFAGWGAMLIGLKREFVRGGVTPPIGVNLKSNFRATKAMASRNR